MDIILLVVHVMLALGVITLVLLQRGAGASAGAVLGGGGGSAGSIFGASGSSNFLSKTTAILAIAFFINSMVLAYMASHREGPASVIDQIEQTESVEFTVPAPATESIDEFVPMPVDTPVESDVPPAVE